MPQHYIFVPFTLACLIAIPDCGGSFIEDSPSEDSSKYVPHLSTIEGFFQNMSPTSDCEGSLVIDNMATNIEAVLEKVPYLFVGYLSTKVFRLCFRAAITFVPLVFVALETASRYGFIGNNEEGIVDWARGANFTAAFEALDLNFPSSLQTSSISSESLNFLYSEGGTLFVGFLAACVV